MEEQHEFLSPGWVEAALAIRDEYADQLPPPPATVRMNLLVTDTPVGDVKASIDTAQAGLLPRLGHIANPELTVRLDYGTAKALFVDQKPEAIAQAFFAGRIAVEGDLSRLFFLQALGPSAEARDLAGEVHARLVAITADHG